MDWNHLFLSFQGRISRQPFWIGVLCLIAVGVVIQLIIASLFAEGTGATLGSLVSLALIYPSLAVYAKRCHDRSKSAWWLLLLLIPLVGLIWLIVDLGILPGTPGPNQYGPDPLA